jgi:hypothetical protein
VFAMQYDIRFPADHDMEVIRTRVRERGHALDDRQGLGLKAYLARDRARGSAVSSYSPFYLWTDEAAAGRFLWGGEGFAGIVADFHRPPVTTWVGGGLQRGPASGTRPVLAGITSLPLPGEVDPSGPAREAAERTVEAASHDEVHSVAWLVDPSRWVLTQVVLALSEGAVAAATPGEGDTAVFEVLHLSTPGLADLW